MPFELQIAFGSKLVRMKATKIEDGTFRIEGRDRVVIISTKQFAGWQKKEWILSHGQMSQETVRLIGKAIEESGNFN